MPEISSNLMNKKQLEFKPLSKYQLPMGHLTLTREQLISQDVILTSTCYDKKLQSLNVPALGDNLNLC